MFHSTIIVDCDHRFVKLIEDVFTVEAPMAGQRSGGGAIWAFRLPSTSRPQALTGAGQSNFSHIFYHTLGISIESKNFAKYEETGTP